MNTNQIAEAYLNVYIRLRNRLDANHASKKTHRFVSDKNALTAAEKKEIAAVFAGCGNFDLIFHTFYKEKAGKFDVYQLPTDLYYKAIDPYFNPLAESKVLDNKCLYSRLFAGIAQAETVVFRMSGHWYDSENRHQSAEQAAALVEKESAVFVKAATASSGGVGVIYLGEEQGAMSVQFNQALQKLSGDVVVQRPIRQHASVAALNESSVNTMRILTLLTEDSVKVYSAVVRIGIDRSKVDNATAGGIFCGIREDGSLRDTAYRLDGKTFKRHPSSGLVFEGHQLVGFDKACVLAQKAHLLMPRFRMISWDMVVDEHGDALMLEANFAKGSLVTHQLANGSLFGEDTPDILDEVFSRRR